MGKAKMIFIVLLLGLGLRIIVLNQSFWLDEAISALAASRNSYLTLITQFTKFDFHPPLFYIALKFWAGIFGYSEISLRILPVLFGVLTIYIIYLIAKELKINAIFASLLQATSPLHVYYSAEVRMYPLVAFFVSLSFLFFFKLLKKQKNIYWVLFSITIVIFMTLDYVPIFVLPVFWIISFLRKKDKNFYIKLVVAYLPLMAISVLWLPILSGQIISGRALAHDLPLWTKIIGSPTFKEMALIWVKFIVGRITFYNKLLYGLVILAASVLFGYAFLNGLKLKFKTLGVWFLAPIVLGFLFSFFVPAFSYFRFLFILPVFYLIIGSSIRSKPAILALLMINLIFLGFYYINENSHRENWREAVAYIEKNASSSDIAVFEFKEPFATWEWYSKGVVSAVGLKGNDLATLLDSKKGVWYFEYLADVTDPQKIALNEIKKLGYLEVSETAFIGVGKITYLRKL